jgi:cytochrome c oxidase cbb3-type subunit 3
MHARHASLMAGAALLGLSICAVQLAAQGRAQAPAQEPAGRGRVAAPGQRGGSFPQFNRPAVDPAIIARGKGLFEANCATCHGADLRGGQLGGPNLLRSQLILSDKSGEAIGPVITGGRPTPPAGMPPMPAFPLPADSVQAIVHYLHSVLATAGRQGRPPGAGQEVPPAAVLIGNAQAGQTYFAANCASCHSATGDLRGIATKAGDPRELQNRWVSGGGGRGGRGAAEAPATAPKPTTVVVTPSSGAPVQGTLVRADDFLVTLITADGTRRTIRRNGDDPKVVITEPMAAHHKFATALKDSDMHNVTAYLWTLK